MQNAEKMLRYSQGCYNFPSLFKANGKYNLLIYIYKLHQRHITVTLAVSFNTNSYRKSERDQPTVLGKMWLLFKLQSGRWVTGEIAPTIM